MMYHSFWYYGFAFFGLILIGYFVVAGSLYWLFYFALEHMFVNYKLHRSPPSRQDILKDIELTTITAVVFAIAAGFILFLYDTGLTLLYTDLTSDTVWYWIISFVAVLILQDTYFYFVHRTLHHPQLFQRLHQGHHQSKHPTPWSAFALDLPDAIAQSLFLIGIVFIVPLHFTTLVAILTTMAIASTIYHLGFDVLPSSFSCHWFGRWLVNPTYHSIHHRKYKVHYGLYFTVWDNLLGTQDPSYEQQLSASHFQSRFEPVRKPSLEGKVPSCSEILD